MVFAAINSADLTPDRDEIHAITVAFAEVAAHYPEMQVPAKAIAWTNLLGVLGFTYGTRLPLIYARLKQAKKAGNKPALVN